MRRFFHVLFERIQSDCLVHRAGCPSEQLGRHLGCTLVILPRFSLGQSLDRKRDVRTQGLRLFSLRQTDSISQLNVSRVFQLTQALLPLLLKSVEFEFQAEVAPFSNPARVINVSSHVHAAIEYTLICHPM